MAVEYHTNGNHTDKARETLREGLKEFPGSYKIMSKLMEFLYYQIYDENRRGDEEKALTDEIITLGEKVLAECTDDECRHSTIQTLCYTYPLAGKSEKAIALAKTMPWSVLSRENLLVMVYRGTEQFEQRRENLLRNVDNVISDLSSLCWGNLDDGSKFFTDEESINLNKRIVPLMNLIFDDGNYGFYRYAVVFAYRNIAEAYGRLNDSKHAIEYLKLASEEAILNDTESAQNFDKKYTCLPLRGRPIGSSYVMEDNIEVKQLLERMENRADYDSIRAEKEFAEIAVKLSESTKTR